MVDPLALVVLLTFNLAIASTLVDGVRRHDVAVVVNAAAALCAAVLPVLLGALATHDAVIGFGSLLSIWIGLAGFLHCLGMIDLYESVWWWDHVTHLVSSALVATLLYAGIIVSADRSAFVPTAPLAVGGTTVLLTFSVGVFWELIEVTARDIGHRFDVEPVLVVYGRRDTALDLTVNAIGAGVVVLLDLRLFVPVAALSPDLTTSVLGWSIATVVVGSLLLALGVWARG